MLVRSDRASDPSAALAAGYGLPFTTRVQRGWHLWGVASLVVAAVTGLFVRSESAFLVAWVLVAALCVVPALGLSVVAFRRVAPVDKPFWRLFAYGILGTCIIGVLILALVLLGIEDSVASPGVVGVAVAAVAVDIALFYGALLECVRSKSTIEVNSIDVIESVMLVIAIGAFAPLVWGDRPVAAGSLWLVVPTAIIEISVLGGVCWSLASFRRVQGNSMPDVKLGMAIGLVCSLNGAAVLVQGMTGFALPASPLLMLQVACFAVVMCVPLHLTNNTPSTYDTLSPLEQTRTRPFDTVAIALLVPLLLATVALQGAVSWAVWYFVGVAIVLLMLATVRGKLAIREARTLYRSVETAAEARRQLLADVLHSADHDRHRVAAQLHQQATAFYVAFSSFLRSTDQDAVNPSVLKMRDDLEQQADELRELMLAVRPLETHETGTPDLRTTIVAYVDNLYTDTAPPQLDIRIDDELALDWTTETIVMRIMQEALRNVAKHAHASRIIISVESDECGLALRVLDDGVGFDTSGLLCESGFRYMRDFAAHVGGHVFIDSEPGTGTTVRAVIGSDAPTRVVSAAGGPRPHLRLVTDDDAEITSAPTTPVIAAQTSVARPSRAPFTSVQSRLAQRRADSDGRRFFYFKYLPSQTVVKEVLQICAASFVSLPLALVAGFTLRSRPDADLWMVAAIVLFGGVLATTFRDVRTYRSGNWDRFDPRWLFGQLTVAMLATGAFGVATGGEVGIFGPVLIITLLIGVCAGSRPMIVSLWVVAMAVLAGVLVITRPGSPTGAWTALFFAFGSALIAGIVHLASWRARNGLQSLEAVADFTSFACSVRDWDSDTEQMLSKVADSVDATAVVVYERTTGGSGQLHELARWPSVEPLSPFVESDLRLLAERAIPDGELVVSESSSRKSQRLALSAPTTSSEIILAVELDRLGQRDDAALIAAVSSLASVIDRSGLIEELLGEARTDPLTGLANRRQLHDYLGHAVGRASRFDEPLAVAMIDLDLFKRFNDRWGHAAGDRVLIAFADRLRSRLRAQDVAARYGGEEFCLLLPNTSGLDATRVLDDLREGFVSDEGELVTFSAGVTELAGDEGGDRLIARADAALYEAKAAGRNRTVPSIGTLPLETHAGHPDQRR